jgi:hypothetical protein
MKRRIGYVVVATFAAFIGCATKRDGLDSESHFACDSNADCSEHAPNLTCVARRCVIAQMITDAPDSGHGPVETMQASTFSSWVSSAYYEDAEITGVEPGPVQGVCLSKAYLRDGAGLSCRAVAFPFPTGEHPCDCTAEGLREPSPELLAVTRDYMQSIGGCGSRTCDDVCGCELLPFAGSTLLTCQQELTPIAGAGWCDVDPVAGAGNPALTMNCSVPSNRRLRIAGVPNQRVLFACTSTQEVPANAVAPSPGDIGDPCTPLDEYSPTFVGYYETGVTIESRSPSCSTGVCLVANFRGRTSCPYGQTETVDGETTVPPDLTPDERCHVPGAPREPANEVTVPVNPQLVSRRPESSVYCSCRCDGPPGEAPFCACPDGFECRHLIDDYGNTSSNQITGSYCIKAGTAVPDPTKIAQEECNRTLTTCDN